MNKRNQRRTGVALLLGLCGGVAVLALDSPATAGRDPNAPPPRPPWIRANGTVDESKIPDEAFLVGDGPNGRAVGPDGKEIKVKTRKDLPPAPSQSQRP